VGAVAAYAVVLGAGPRGLGRLPLPAAWTAWLRSAVAEEELELEEAIRPQRAWLPESSRATLSLLWAHGEVPVMAGPGDEVAATAGRGHLRVPHADREQVINVLKAAFVQGKLIEDERDALVSRTFAARTYADLAAAKTLVTLTPGRTGNFVLRIVDTGALPASSCDPVTVHWLKIFPPDNTGARHLSYST
jgi:hypothetical protein